MTVSIFVDGAVAGTRFAGAAAIARTSEGYFLGWLSEQYDPMTNNEAEYHGVLLGLQLAKRLGLRQVEIVSDSQVVVRQMLGQSRVNSNRLHVLHQQTVQRVATFKAVRFRHVLRNLNSLADALATEALLGQTVNMRPAQSRGWLRPR